MERIIHFKLILELRVYYLLVDFFFFFVCEIFLNKQNKN